MISTSYGRGIEGEDLEKLGFSFLDNFISGITTRINEEAEGLVQNSKKSKFIKNCRKLISQIDNIDMNTIKIENWNFVDTINSQEGLKNEHSKNQKKKLVDQLKETQIPPVFKHDIQSIDLTMKTKTRRNSFIRKTSKEQGNSLLQTKIQNQSSSIINSQRNYPGEIVRQNILRRKAISKPQSLNHRFDFDRRFANRNDQVRPPLREIKHRSVDMSSDYAVPHSYAKNPLKRSNTMGEESLYLLLEKNRSEDLVRPESVNLQERYSIDLSLIQKTKLNLFEKKDSRSEASFGYGDDSKMLRIVLNRGNQSISQDKKENRKSVLAKPPMMKRPNRTFEKDKENENHSLNRLMSINGKQLFGKDSTALADRYESKHRYYQVTK